MSGQLNDGGPAYPIADSHYANGQVQYGCPGMTLRDYFAGQALAGFASENGAISSASPYTLARGAYSVAEAMLDVRKEGATE